MVQLLHWLFWCFWGLLATPFFQGAPQNLKKGKWPEVLQAFHFTAPLEAQKYHPEVAVITERSSNRLQLQSNGAPTGCNYIAEKGNNKLQSCPGVCLSNPFANV